MVFVCYQCDSVAFLVPPKSFNNSHVNAGQVRYQVGKLAFKEAYLCGLELVVSRAGCGKSLDVDMLATFLPTVAVQGVAAFALILCIVCDHPVVSLCPAVQ